MYPYRQRTASKTEADEKDARVCMPMINAHAAFHTRCRQLFGVMRGKSRVSLVKKTRVLKPRHELAIKQIEIAFY